MEILLRDKSDEMQRERLLVEAASNGDLRTVLILLEFGVSVDADKYNRSLFYACKNYMTPLQAACHNGYATCVEALIAHGADVNAKNHHDVTAMHLAAVKGNFSCLKALLNANAECSLPTKSYPNGCYTTIPLEGSTPLHLATAGNHVECVQELIQYGADYNAVDFKGRTSLYVAAQLGYEDCVISHIKNAHGPDILSLPSYNTRDTPLHFAVNRGMVECVRILLSSGSDVNHTNTAGYSPLHLAVRVGMECGASMEILRMLVIEGHDTNINLADHEKLTPLHYVCFNSRGNMCLRLEMAKFLLSYGANIDIKDTRGSSLLECKLTLTSGDFELLKYILRSMLHPPHLTKFSVPQLPWYQAIASNPRTLQHYCRYTIRKNLGPHRMKFVTKLPVPSYMQSYLLLQNGE